MYFSKDIFVDLEVLNVQASRFIFKTKTFGKFKIEKLKEVVLFVCLYVCKIKKNHNNLLKIQKLFLFLIIADLIFRSTGVSTFRDGDRFTSINQALHKYSLKGLYV